MSKNYALFDWDNTIRTGYTLYSWIDYLRERNILSDSVYHEIDDVRQQYAHGLISHDQYASSACRKYAKSLSGVSEDQISVALSQYMPRDRECLFANIGDIFDILNKNNIEIIVISGAPAIIVGNYAEEFHIQRVFAFKEGTYNGIFTGEVEYNYGFDKTGVVKEIMQNYGKRPLFAFGDSTSDIPMLETAIFAYCIGNELKEFKNIHITRKNRIPQSIVSEIRRIAVEGNNQKKHISI